MDDEQAIRSALRRALQRFGYEVLTAEGGEAALELLGAPGAVLPQVVISDQRLQHMDGVTFLTRVKERWPIVQRVLLTGFADVENIERAVNEAGIYRFLSKPWEDVSLLGTVRSAYTRPTLPPPSSSSPINPRRSIVRAGQKRRRLRERHQARRIVPAIRNRVPAKAPASPPRQS